jgi:poly-gamma-glutamate capsule biosynthesis protein CapA/YwtB (metallophosphatase superfamily)
MNRRDFVRSTGRWLLALAGMGAGQAAAAPKSSARGHAAANHSVTLFLTGDVMTGRGVDQVLPHPGDPQIHESYMKSALGYVELAEEATGPIQRPADFDYIWGDALEVLSGLAPDLRIINLETSITTSGDFWPRKGIHYRMHPANTPVISAAGIDCCVLANNHVLDWGYAGLAETLDTLHRAGLRTAGAGSDLGHAMAPAVLELGDKGRVIVLGAASPSSGVPSAWAAAHDRAGVNYIADYSAASVQRIAGRVRALKRPGDIVVLSVHWGGNWGYHVPPKLCEFARGLIDQAAVDVIHGHSSHHPRGIEVYRGRPIIYGCGDLLNDYEGIGGREEYRGDLSLMYFVSLDVTSGELTRLHMVPMRMRQFRLNRASAEEAGWMATTLDRESRRFGSRVDLEADGSLGLGWGEAAVDASPASHSSLGRLTG